MSKSKPGSDAASTAGKAAPKGRRNVVRIEDRVPVMTDGDLKALQANAERLAAGGADAQKADALRLLPIIGAEVDARAAARAKAAQERRQEKSRPRRQARA